MTFNLKRSMYLAVNLCAFTLGYMICNALAQHNGVSRNVALSIDSLIPFLPWMIVPYLSSGVIFVLSLFWVDKRELASLSQRLLLATVCACLVFSLYPLQFSFARPAISSPLCAALFKLLDNVDRPYNQLPSLHVAYCVIIWASTRSRLHRLVARFTYALWLLLVAVATLFTFQHHVLDVLTGAVLGIACTTLLPVGRNEAHVGFYYAMAAALVFIVWAHPAHSVLAWYLVGSLLLVSLAYWRRQDDFLRKRGGRHPWYSWLLYAPYLSGYWLTWLAVKYRERRKPACYRVAPQLWIGRRLTATQSTQLPKDCVVVDLSIELRESIDMTRHRYLHFPMLDLLRPSPELIARIVTSVRAEIVAGHTVYLHCAMGYSRCILIAQHITLTHHDHLDLPT